MPHGPHYVESKGACIYCRATDVPLTDEHIVPYALGGSHVLRKASCRRCARITSKFERRVLRDLWGDARIAFNAPSRRKRSRKRVITMPAATDQGRRFAVPASQFPGAFVFYKMAQAGLLRGLQQDLDVSAHWQLVVVDDDKRRERFLATHPKTPLTIRFRHVPHDFGRLLAKIGLGHVLTQLDLDDFRPICVPYVLGRKPNVSYVVGGTMENQEPEPDIGYRLETRGFGTAQRIILVALVRLLANTAAPAYHVVVGDIVGADRVESVLAKLGDAFVSVLSSDHSHWTPQIAIDRLWNLIDGEFGYLSSV